MSKDDALDVETVTSMMDAGSITITSGDSEPRLALGEAADLLYCLGKIDKEVSSSFGKQKVLHMLHKQLG